MDLMTLLKVIGLILVILGFLSFIVGFVFVFDSLMWFMLGVVLHLIADAIGRSSTP